MQVAATATHGGRFESLELLPLVKAYPNLSRRYRETSCIAGLTIEDAGSSQWIRLYPVPFRQLEEERQFSKYEPITVRVQPARGDDRRPESRRADADSIEPSGRVVGTGHEWRARRLIVEPMMRESMCAIREAEKADRTSLEIFRPAEVLDLVIDEVEPDPEKGAMAADWAAQGSLLDPQDQEQQRKALEQIPYRFRYRYRCSTPGCGTHSQSIVDWELAQFYRNVSRYPDWRERLRAKWLDEMCGPEKDTAFIVGNQQAYRQGFLVLGVWWPPLQPTQPQLPFPT